MENKDILENKTNFLIIRDNDLIKLYSYKSLVCIYNITKKIYENLEYSFNDINGNIKTYSRTTQKHLSKFKTFILTNKY